VTIGAAITGALPFMRAQAESMMTDSCVITRASGDPVFNATTGKYDTPTPDTIYTGKCRIRTRSQFLRDRAADGGEHQVLIWSYIVSVPLTVTDIRVDDVVTVTASTDPALVERELKARITNLATNSTARRIDCEEIAR
jgi:hypothetical protein